jgi:hypothetical protein
MQTLLPQGFPIEAESVSNVTLANSVNLGETRFINGEEYVYVYNAGVQQISVSQFAVLSANSGFSVTVSSVTQYDFPIGFVKHSTITTGGYGWLLSRGFTKVAMAANASATTSDVLYPAAAGLVAAAGNALSAGCGIVLQPIGYVVSGAASAGSGSNGALAYVRCYGT